MALESIGNFLKGQKYMIISSKMPPKKILHPRSQGAAAARRGRGGLVLLSVRARAARGGVVPLSVRARAARKVSAAQRPRSLRPPLTPDPAPPSLDTWPPIRPRPPQRSGWRQWQTPAPPRSFSRAWTSRCTASRCNDARDCTDCVACTCGRGSGVATS